MKRLRLGGHTWCSALLRLCRLAWKAGPGVCLRVVAAAVEDRLLCGFDRRHGTQTSGAVHLRSTSLDKSKLRHATGYAPVTASALRHLLRELSLPKGRHFADLGCGLGRACILAAEYGFARITGVDLVREFCEMARTNIAAYRRRTPHAPPVEILEEDALDFCERTDADVFFMFRPFSLEFTKRIGMRLAQAAVRWQRPLTVIYTEKLLMERSYAKAFPSELGFRKVRERVILGQAFHVFECGVARCSPDY